jgi:hypothetical protein
MKNITYDLFDKPLNEPKLTKEVIDEFNAMSNQQKLSMFLERQENKIPTKFDPALRIWMLNRY